MSIRVYIITIVNFSINTTANEIDTLIHYKLKQHYIKLNIPVSLISNILNKLHSITITLTSSIQNQLQL